MALREARATRVTSPAGGDHRRGATAGFTLFELLVVILIVAVAGALAAPALQSGWRSREVRQGTRKLAGVMRALREQAIRRGAERELVVESDGQTVRWSDGAGFMLADEAAITGIRGGWRDADGSVRVVFYPNGGATGASFLVGGVSEGGLRFAIEVDPLLGSVVIREATS